MTTAILACKYNTYIIDTLSLAVISTKMLFLRLLSFTCCKNPSKLAFSPISSASFHELSKIPPTLKTIVLESEIPITLIFNFRFFFKNFFCFCNCAKNRSPTFPTPVMNKFSCFIRSSKKRSCRVLSAFLASFLEITAEIFFSEAPCAMALTFTLFFPNALNIFPLRP